jgi:hypothetical protein
MMQTRYQDTKRELFIIPPIGVCVYNPSLVLNVFFTRAISNRSKHQPVIFNCVNPGLCHSELRRDVKSKTIQLTAILLAWSAEEGSRQLIWSAIGLPENESLDEMRGAYINRASIEEPSDFVLGEEGKKREDKLFVSPDHCCLSITDITCLRQADTISVIQKIDPRVEDIVSQYLT